MIDLDDYFEIHQLVSKLIDLQILYKRLNRDFSEGNSYVEYKLLGVPIETNTDQLVKTASLDFDQIKNKLKPLGFETDGLLTAFCKEKDIYINTLGEIIKEPDSEWVSVAKKAEYSPETLKKGQ